MACFNEELGLELGNAPEGNELEEVATTPEPGTLKFCPFCFGDDLKEISEDGDMYVKWCQQCQRAVGWDDVSSEFEINSLFPDMETKACLCGNADLSKCVIRQSDIGFRLYCQGCDSDIQLNSLIPQDTVCAVELECSRCRNENKDLFDVEPVPGENGEIYTVKCHICDNKWVRDSNGQEILNPQCQKCGDKDENTCELIRQGSDVVAAKCRICDSEWLLKKKQNLDKEYEDTFSLHCKCGNSNKDCFHLFRDDKDGHIFATKCLVCDNERILQCDMHQENEWKEGPTFHNQKTRISGRTKITDLSDLQEGDHIFWKRPAGHEHHALVTTVYPSSNEALIIHLTKIQSLKTGIVEQKLKQENGNVYTIKNDGGNQELREKEKKEKKEKEKGTLFRRDYDSECFPPHIAIERSRNFGKSYNLLTNNCEHFVTWCKTGRDESEQVKGFASVVLEGGGKGASWFASKGVNEALELAMKKCTTAAVKAASKKILRVLTTTKCLGIGFVLGVEIASTVYDVYKAYKKKQRGGLSGDEFFNEVVDRIAQCVGGTLLASLALFIPGIGPLIVCPLASILGRWGGRLFGRFICKITKECKDAMIDK